MIFPSRVMAPYSRPFYKLPTADSEFDMSDAGVSCIADVSQILSAPLRQGDFTLVDREAAGSSIRLEDGYNKDLRKVSTENLPPPSRNRIHIYIYLVSLCLTCRAEGMSKL
jgi:hypothetical protein